MSRSPSSAPRSLPSAVRHERDRLAELLHSTVCQELTGICLMASAAARQHGTAGTPAAEQLREIADQIQHVGRHLAEIVHGLRDAA